MGLVELFGSTGMGSLGGRHDVVDTKFVLAPSLRMIH
jgi:hypothetical protein